jgi:DUF2975 family protein
MRALGKGSIAEIIRVGLVVSWAVLWLCGGALVLVAGAYALNALGVVDFHAFFGPNARLGVDDLTVPADGPSWLVVVPAFLAGLVIISGGLVIVWHLRRLFDSFCSGQPFAKENASHLRAIWVTMIAIEVARYLLLALTGALLANFGGPLSQQVQIKLHISLSTWASILILVVLAEVFREGARMRAEQELTI